MSSSSDFTSFFSAFENLQSFPSIESQLSFISAQLDNQPTVGDILSLMIEDQSSSLIFKDLAEEFRVINQIQSCYLSTNDVQTVMGNFIASTSSVSLMAQAYVTG